MVSDDITIQGLWKDILEQPTNYDLRLILADYLEDHGNEGHANFIRQQIKTGLVKHFFPSGTSHLETQLHPWLNNYLAQVIPHDMKDTIFTVMFRGGFIEGVHGPFNELRIMLPTLITLHPIRKVKTDKKPVRVGAGEYYEHYYFFCSSSDESSDDDPNHANIPSSLWDIPSSLWDRLKTTFKTHPDFVDHHCKDYASEEDAHTSLSEALLEEAHSSQIRWQKLGEAAE